MVWNPMFVATCVPEQQPQAGTPTICGRHGSRTGRSVLVGSKCHPFFFHAGFVHRPPRTPDFTVARRVTMARQGDPWNRVTRTVPGDLLGAVFPAFCAEPYLGQLV